MNIGFHAWEPGLTTGRASSAAGTKWMGSLLRYLKTRNHTNVWLARDQQTPYDAVSFAVEDIKYLDVAVFNWRWAMPGYPERHQLYKDQMALLNLCEEEGVPVIIHDEDHKISFEDERWLTDFVGATLTAPELFPRDGYERLMYPNPYGPEDSYDIDVHRQPFLSEYAMVYIGNNYGRFDQTVGFLAPFSAKFRTKVFGNWLERNAERESPEDVRAALPNVEFGLRIGQHLVVDNLAIGDSTVHLFKPSYGPTGFVTMRWAEAAAAATPAFIPREFALPRQHKEAMQDAIVGDGYEMVSAWETWTEDTYRRVLSAQKAFVNEYMRFEPWEEMIERVAKGRK